MAEIYSTREIKGAQNDLKSESSKIQQFFAGTTIFITGGTGFLGKILVEKLLRTCYGIRRIYILVRPKRNKTSEKRFEEYFSEPLYDLLKKERPEALEKLFMIMGDCEYPNLGMNDEDVQKIISEVNCIFHVAATVRFNEHLRIASYINVKATKDIVNISRKIHNLKSFVYVSTAFSFCQRKSIDEIFYEPGMKADDLLSLVDAVSEQKLAEITPILIKDWPNTYVFTKAVAEDLIKREGGDLPVAVVRPSIVVSTSKEPIPGWIDNYYGSNGVYTGGYAGIIRTMIFEPHYAAEQVPADYVVNNIIAAGWSAGCNNKNNISRRSVFCSAGNEETENISCQKTGDIPIFNYISSVQKPITWEKCSDLAMEQVSILPSMKTQWYIFFKGSSSRTVFLFLHFILHVVPGCLADVLLIIFGKRPILMKAYKKIKSVVDIVSYFTTNEWCFTNENTQALWKSMGLKDRELFYFDMASFNWNDFAATYTRGLRLYLLKDPIETLPQARKRALKLKTAHYVLVGCLLYLFLRLFLILMCLTI